MTTEYCMEEGAIRCRRDQVGPWYCVPRANLGDHRSDLEAMANMIELNCCGTSSRGLTGTAIDRRESIE